MMHHQAEKANKCPADSSKQTLQCSYYRHNSLEQPSQQLCVYSCACIPKAYADMKNITSAILLENLCLIVSRIRSHSSHTSPFSTYAHTHEACPCHSPTDTSLGWADTRFPEYAPQAEQAALLSLTGRQATELR